MAGIVAAGVALGIAEIGSSYLSARGANKAAGKQVDAANRALEFDQKKFDEIQRMIKPFVAGGQRQIKGLNPYLKFGVRAATRQANLLGLQGAEAQQASISAIEGGPELALLAQQGEEAILQNAAATGGVRGGNTQAALAQFRPRILSDLISLEIERLGGVSAAGRGSALSLLAAGTGAAATLGEAAQAQADAFAAQQQRIGQAEGDAVKARYGFYSSIPSSIAEGVGFASGLKK